MGDLADIKKAFYDRLELFDTNIPKVTENTDYEYTEGTTWMRSYHLTGDTSQVSLGSNGTDAMYGLFQVDILYAAKAGDVQPALIADALNAHIPSGMKLIENTNNIESFLITSVKIERAFEDRSWYVLPVSFYYRATRGRL